MFNFTSKRTYFIVFSSVLFFLTLSFYSNSKFYKQYIIDKIESSLKFQIDFQDSNLKFFPAPGITLEKVNIKSKTFENKIDLKVNSMEFYFSWEILFGNIELNNIIIEEGTLEYSTSQKSNTSIPEFGTSNFDPKNLQNILSFLNLNLVRLESIQLKLEKDSSILDEVYFKYLEIRSDHESVVNLDFDINYQLGNFKSETKFLYTKNTFTYESLQIYSKWKFKNFNLKPFKKYYSIIQGANFDNTHLDGEIIFLKEKAKTNYNVKSFIDVNNLLFSDDPVYPVISIKSEFVFFPDSKKVNFISLNFVYTNGAIASATGTLTFPKDINLNLDIKGEYADIYKVIYLIVRFADINTKEDVNFFAKLNIFVNKAVFEPYEFQKVNLDFNIENSLIQFNIYNTNTLNGQISGKGKLIASQNSNYDINISLKQINSEELIKKYTDRPYVKGSLNSDFHFTSTGNSLASFLENLKSKGKLEIKNGELLGYANILKPIFSLGKLVNILGPRGKNTEFQFLTFNYDIHSKNIYIKSLKMLGVGIDAHGEGKINFDRKIDFRVYAGLGGFAGKALYVPIIYQGIIPENVSYIDPIWIGSVYVGATLLAGPAGATIGGVTGSAISEYVNKAWDGIKGLFSKEEKEE